ncbi:MAG: VOC family protein [Rhodospirillales bacterium]|nr:VOC family protein [Rhodospirillales bacterium]MCB9980219.1 VOC family protein [Rhodospirillales bacterium]
MHYLHTMVRIRNVEDSLNFYCKGLGLVEVSRMENEAGRYTLIFLCAPEDLDLAKDRKAPLLELTYNWPDEQGHVEGYAGGRNFGHLAYRVENIYEICQKLRDLGIMINRPPRDGHMAFVKSPDGISIELLQKGDHLSPQEPWASMPNTGSW